jgi:tRNA-Thr(GGU) m(6)t(6)A37 methyltransferase TsaA
MKTKTIELEAIGVIKTPWETPENMPIQPIGAKGIKGIVEVYPKFSQGLKGVAGFSHIMLIYQLHLVKNPQLEVVPFMDNTPKGIFATRSPKRPNKIGISVVEIEKLEGNKIHIVDVDMMNNSPLLDIKPYFEDFDNRTGTKKGWLTDKKDIDKHHFKSDKRFI